MRSADRAGQHIRMVDRPSGAKRAGLPVVALILAVGFRWPRRARPASRPAAPMTATSGRVAARPPAGSRRAPRRGCAARAPRSWSSRSATSHPGRRTARTWRPRTVAGIDPDLVLGLGDFQYQKGSPRAFNNSYDRSWGRFLPRTYPINGTSHDLYGTGEYVDYWNGGSAGAHGRTPIPQQAQWSYSFDRGGWHFVALNTSCWQRDDRRPPATCATTPGSRPSSSAPAGSSCTSSQAPRRTARPGRIAVTVCSGSTRRRRRTGGGSSSATDRPSPTTASARAGDSTIRALFVAGTERNVPLHPGSVTG